jgi:hypothetical protein
MGLGWQQAGFALYFLLSLAVLHCQGRGLVM